MTAKPTIKQVFLAILSALGMRAHLCALESVTHASPLTGMAVTRQDYLVGYEWRQDADGTEYGPYIVFDFRQKLFRDFTADVSTRIFKTASSDDGASLYLETAAVAYVGSWCTVAGGRRNLGDFLSPGSFFGAYTTMGERQLDSVGLSLPFRLSADLPDSESQVSSPYNAVTFLYVPNLFEADKTQFDGRQGVVLAQLKVKFRLRESSSDLFFNYAFGLDGYFVNGSPNTSGALEVCYALHSGPWACFVDYGIQSLAQVSGTSVLAAGASVDAQKWTWGFLKTLEIEGQLPLGPDRANPFTGGNPQNLSLAQTPQVCWFVGLRNRLGEKTPNAPLRLFYGGALTNSVGDYTYARLVEGSINQPVGKGFGEGPKIEGLTLRAANYLAPAGIIYAGYEF